MGMVNIGDVNIGCRCSVLIFVVLIRASSILVAGTFRKMAKHAFHVCVGLLKEREGP